ncbi:hypothetical protein TNCV_3690801 [Trichonephila clavipes]|nr:hypothetical protein TNCV_3690801 [Trichonephila clavipes]
MTSAGKKKSNGANGMQHSSGHINDFIGIKGVMAAVGVYVEEGRGNRDATESAPRAADWSQCSLYPASNQRATS